MEKILYPLKFKPIIKDKIWGGNKLRDVLNKSDASEKSGESWEISGVKNNISIVNNGFLKGNNLEELIEVYMGDLVGEKVFNKFGLEFPLLIKYIDANDDLSIQVHPDDELAATRHQSYGKTEMWYIMETEKDASLIVGFNEKVSPDQYAEYLNNNKLEKILNKEKISPGDVYYIPAGRIHAICSGTLLAEIQQTSDVTYRIYDYNRTDKEGNHRELHTELALNAIDFNVYDSYKTNYHIAPNETNNLVKCDYFVTNFLKIDKSILRNYHSLDSFVILMCTEGKSMIHYNNDEVLFEKGETLLIPAELKDLKITPEESVKLLEIFLP